MGERQDSLHLGSEAVRRGSARAVEDGQLLEILRSQGLNPLPGHGM